MDRLLSVSDSIPAVLTKRQLASYLQVSVRQVDRFRRLRNHPGVKELEAPGQVRFDGRAFREWLDGKEAERPRAKVRHFFSKAG